MNVFKGLVGLLLTWFDWLRDRSRSQESKTTPAPALSSSASRSTKMPTTPKTHLRKLIASHDNLKEIYPIRYAYDTVPIVASYLRPIPLSFLSGAAHPCSHLSRNSTRIYPLRGGLPYRSSLNYVRTTKHFQANILESVAVLESIVAEKSSADIPVGKAGITLAELAQKELRPGFADRMAAATTYMFPAADEKRLRIIATLIILYFIFDGKPACSSLWLV